MSTAEEANKAVAAADAAAAEAAGVQWKEIQSLVRWDKPLSDAVTSPVHANCVDDVNGNYPLHIAAQNGHVTAIKFLLGAGSKVNAQNGTGQTPLHMAVAYDFHDAVALLMVFFPLPFPCAIKLNG